MKPNPTPVTQAAENPATANPNRDNIKINGFQQVLDMLKAADPEFRISLLRRLAGRDQTLARSLQQELVEAGLL